MRGENGWEITVQRSGGSDNKKMEDRSILSAKGKLLLLVDYRVVLDKTQFEWIIYRALPTMVLRRDVAVKTCFLPPKKGTKGGMTLRRSEGETTIPDLYFRRARDQMYYEKRSRKDEEFRRMARRARAQLFSSSLSFHLIVYRSSRNRFVINGPFTFTALH